MVVAALVSGVIGLLTALSGQPRVALYEALCGVTLGVMLRLPFEDHHQLLRAGVIVGTVQLAALVLFAGRVDAALTVWLVMPTVGAVLLGARRAAAISGSIAIVTLGVVAVLEARGWHVPGAVSITAPPWMTVLSGVSAIAIVALLKRVDEAERRRLIEAVDERNEELAAALEDAHLAHLAALRANEAKERFFAELTHEIRTPLNGILGTAELLAETDLTDEQGPLVDALGTSAVNLVALVNAMLEQARLRSGAARPNLGPCDVRRAAGDLQRLFAAQAAERGIALDVVVAPDVPTLVETDSLRVRQVTGNLVGNAIKFTERGGVRVGISVSREPDDRLWLVVEVADTGTGVEPARLAAIFDPYVQEDDTIGGRFGGTGLGLSIARQLAELLGGTLTAESTPGRGSTFTLVVPVRPLEAPSAAAVAGDPADAPVEPASGAAEPAPGADALARVAAVPVAAPADAAEATPSSWRASGRRVLIAADDAVNRAVLTRMLETLGCVALTAADGAEAVALAGSAAVDLILMDLHMPGTDGLAATRAIRAQASPAGPDRVPVIAVTGSAIADVETACRAAGVDGFLLKPFRIGDLDATIAAFARGRTRG